MWGDSKDGTYMSGQDKEEERIEALVGKLSGDQLKEFVRQYLNYRQEGYLDDLDRFVIRTLGGANSLHLLQRHPVNIRMYDAACREIARRWFKGTLEPPDEAQ